MTEQGKYFIEEFKKGNVLLESMQTLYKKGHISKDEFIEVVGKEPQQKQIDNCSTKTTEEKLEELMSKTEEMDDMIAELMLQI